MVLKLIKNEFKDSSKKFLPILGLIVTVTLLLSFAIRSSSTAQSMALFNVIIVLFVFGLFVGIVVLSFMAFIHLLYTSLYNKNGYRLFTLPVDNWEIITSKISVYFIWNIIISVVSVLSVMVFLAISIGDFEYLEIFFDFMSYILSQFELRVLLVYLLNYFTSTLMTLSLFLFVGSLVNSAFIQNNRGLKMFVLFIFFDLTLSQVMMRVIGYETGGLNIIFNPDSFITGQYNPLVDGWGQLISISTNLVGLQRVALSSILYTTIALLLFFATNWLWNHKLEIID